MGKRNRRFNEAAKNNNYSWRQYYDRLVSLAISMFEWSGLPDSIDVRYLELALFTQGSAVFFKDDELGDYLALRCIANGPFNVYNIPKNRRAVAANGYQHELTENDSVIIWNNLLHTNSELDVRNFAERLWNLDRAIDVNANAQKTPILIRCDPDQELTLKNMYMQYDGNMPVIYGRSSLSDRPLECIATGAPYVADKLYQLKTQIWNEALTYLGISNVNTQKKERLITDEAIRQMGGVIANRYARLEARRQAAEAINKMFKLEISVDFRDDFREADDEWMLPDDTVTDGGAEPTAIVTDLRSDTPNLREV